MPRIADSVCVFRSGGMRHFDGDFVLPSPSGAADGVYVVDAARKFNFSIDSIAESSSLISVA